MAIVLPDMLRHSSETKCKLIKFFPYQYRIRQLAVLSTVCLDLRDQSDRSRDQTRDGIAAPTYSKRLATPKENTRQAATFHRHRCSKIADKRSPIPLTWSCKSCPFKFIPESLNKIYRINSWIGWQMETMIPGPFFQYLTI